MGRKISCATINAIFSIVESPDEKNGVKLWAARAAAHLSPQHALAVFTRLREEGLGVDGDAWVMLGPIALESLISECEEQGCSRDTAMKIHLIFSDSPKDRSCRAVVPLLLQLAVRYPESRVASYLALGGLGDELVPLMEELETTADDPKLRAVAGELLESVRQK